MSSSNELMARAVLAKTRRELARRLFSRFVAYTKEDFVFAPHHLLIAEKLQAVLEGKIKRLYIGMPPRHGKSQLSSIHLAAMYLAWFPHNQIIHASYSADLSHDFSRQVRAMIRDDFNFKRLFPHVQLDPERQNIADWKTTAGGGFYSIGVGGGVTGHGAHMFIIDDPHKEGDAESPTILDNVALWYATAARTRLMPGGIIVFPMTRWHPEDLIGRQLQLAADDPNADQWETLVLPAIAGKDDILGRAEGEALWSDWYPKESLMALRAINEPQFEALYQQNPQPQSGKLFDRAWFNQCIQPPDYAAAPAAWCFDLALTDKERSDYNAWARVSYNGERLHFGKLHRQRATWADTKPQILALMDAHPDDEFCFPKQLLELVAMQELRRERPNARIREVSLPGDKRSRAAVLATRAQSGRVDIEVSEHTAYWLTEHDTFQSTFDDCVDVGSVATHHFGIHQEFYFAIKRAEEERPTPDAFELDTMSVLRRH